MKKAKLIKILFIALITTSIACKKGSENTGSDEPPAYKLLYLQANINGTNFLSGICTSTGPYDKYTPVFTLFSPFTADSFFVASTFSPQYGKNDMIYFLGDFNNIRTKPYSINPDGSNLRVLTNVDEATYYAMNVSPVTGRMVCERDVSSADQYQLITCNADGSNVKVIKTLQSGYQGMGFGGANWFPDGETVIFSMQDNFVNTPSPMSLYSIKYDGTGLKKLSNTTDKLYLTPTVSPNGKRILYTHRDGSSYNTFVVNSDMTNDRKVVIPNSNVKNYSNLNWHADSRWFAYLYASTIILADADGDGTKFKTIGANTNGGRLR